MRKHAATIVLVLLAVGLGLWLWIDRDRVTEGERKRRENSVFTAWRRDELLRLEIAHEGETLVIERERQREPSGDPPAWRMTSPRSERVDVQAVERLMTTLEFASVVRRASEGDGLGFDPPRASGSVTMGGLVVRFALGGVAPRPEGAGYFRVDDGPPLVVSKELAQALLAHSDTYRDRMVIPYLARELSRFEVSHPQGGFAVERHDEHAFRVADAGVLAHRPSLEKIWAALGEMRAESFPKDADVDRLTASPRLTIKMTPKEGGVAELVVGEECPGHPSDVVVLRKTPTRASACAPKAAIEALFVAPGTLVDKRPFSVAMDEMEEVRLEWLAGDAGPPSPAAIGRGPSAPIAIEIARKGKGFHERAPDDRDLDQGEAAAATALLERIAHTEAEVVRRGGGAPFSAIARARVRFGDREQIVEVGAPDTYGRAWLRRLDDDARLDVPVAAVRRLVPRATSLRPLSLLEKETRRPTRIILRCGTPQELADTGEGFRFVDPKGYDADGSIVPLVDAILRGRVDSWVSDVDDGSFGDTKDPCRVIVAFEDGNAPLTVALGAAGERGVYGRVESRPEIFVAPASIRDIASRIYVSRASLRTDPARIESVRVSYPGKPAPDPLDPSALRDAVSGLIADRVVAIGPNAKAGLRAPDLLIDVSVAEGGPARRIACRLPERANDDASLCTTDAIAATFEMPVARLRAFLPPPPDASPLAGDGGSR
ncbi:MAG: hypothetical protein KF819_19485 [Labilithrix sp.]|nr:hypothetical protein [Labilithrix sp.]